MGNHNSGRRPQATALKVLRGNPGKRKLNQQEPKPREGPVNRPETLSVSAVLAWNDLAPECLAMGTLTTADVEAFATLCELVASRRKASSLKDVGSSPDVPTSDPLAAIRTEIQVATALRPYFEKFGLEPVGRARISVPKPPEEKSKWAGLVG